MKLNKLYNWIIDIFPSRDVKRVEHFYNDNYSDKNENGWSGLAVTNPKNEYYGCKVEPIQSFFVGYDCGHIAYLIKLNDRVEINE